VGTADCVPVVLEGPGAVGLAHAGWRGAAAGVVPALRRAMESAGVGPVRAAVGPGIGPCCYEVGPEVLARLEAFAARTRRGTDGVDLPAAAAAGLQGLEVWQAGACTSCDPRFHSYRRDGTKKRQVALAWLP
jgi:copper oxidase (laccase) domain-containing protein